MLTLLQRFGEGVGRRWCHATHPAPMWPVHGKYLCPRCLRQFPVQWESTGDRAVMLPVRPQDYADPAMLDALRKDPGRLHA